MRRRRKALDGVPAELAEFREADWPGATWRDRYDIWRAAQDAHAETHGWPRGGLDLLMRRLLVRHRHDGTRLPLGVSDYFGLPPERDETAGRLPE